MNEIFSALDNLRHAIGNTDTVSTPDVLNRLCELTEIVGDLAKEVASLGDRERKTLQELRYRRAD